MGKPTLVVVSGPGGAGKTTIARNLARAIGCPAICRDEIKEGMVHASPEFEGAYPGDPLTMRTFPLFFEVLELLVKNGVTVVAEAAFQDQNWRKGLEPLADLAEIRIVQCHIDADVAHARSVQRMNDNPVRRAHADTHSLTEIDDIRELYANFDRVSLPVPTVDVDTTDGYSPSLQEIISFIDKHHV